MRFTKMHALGNDFIVIDSREAETGDAGAMARRICRRRFGVGADQMLVLGESGVADFRMRIFNADGSEVEMCGNGIRCLAKYVWDRELSNSDVLRIETRAGIIVPERFEGMIRVDMGEPVLEGREIPVGLDGKVLDHPLRIEDNTFMITCVSMGNPHAVVFLEGGLDEFAVGRYGPMIENHALFPKRINVEFVEVLNPSEIRMRVWERGAGETPACGTGASASAVASSLKGLAGREVTVHLAGGDLSIEWAENGRVYMTGPADEVYTGEIKT
jgi:diaminopimelate epimerase